MYIDARTVIFTLAIVAVGAYFGLQLIRKFALSIAQENHDANLAIDMTEEARRAKRERDADDAASAAFAKVEPLLPSSVVTKGMSLTKNVVGVGAAATLSGTKVASAPSSGGLKVMKKIDKSESPPSTGGISLTKEPAQSEQTGDAGDEETPVEKNQVDNSIETSESSLVTEER
mmetsp:Transcript_31573/g.64398  ORF Transcript_31573/g.64398 Transcript_31573/m.64398 type:complete len:174 (-) Transcript_31573:162-683(-)